ncbi:macrolide family glycosyltransferase [Faecalispora anaeroviscerum]|uniref:macrolide family glycosyltransferase n=1 Tax=Faecalispora anaeroviscerum TaxID=2991836 RepID=UPI0024B8BC75|nr:macrolide family glycosyltransferase [Faecalispora anaeroviscerum]
MNILFVNLPFSGHVYPTLGLVRELICRGNEVTYLLTEQWKEAVLQTGAQFACYQDDKKLSIQMQNAYHAGVKLAHNFDLILYEQFFFLGKHLAEQFHKPVIRIFTSPASNKELMKAYINAGGMMGIFRLKWICQQWTKQVSKGITLKTDCWLEEIVQNPPELNLVYTIREFQPYADSFSDEHYKFLGASIYPRDKNPDLLLEQIKHPLIYISLGTVVNRAKGFYQKCFDAFRSENVTVVLSIGNSIDKNSLREIPENFLIYPFVPQLEVLEKCNVFITHGGLNSVTEALYFGVPMVVIPFMSDQPINANRIEELELGKRLERKRITSTVLKNTTMDVIQNKRILQNVRSMQSKMRCANGNKYGAEIIIDYGKRYC